MRKFKVGDILTLSDDFIDSPFVREKVGEGQYFVVLKVNTPTGGVIVAEKDDPERKEIRHPASKGFWSRHVFNLAPEPTPRDVEIIRYKL